MHTASTTLPPEPMSARACRRFLVATLEAWGATGFNAVLHAGTDIEVVVRLRADLLRIEVRDGDPRLASVRHYSVLSGTGRGLALVAETAKSWSAEPRTDGPGKTVWFELEA